MLHAAACSNIGAGRAPAVALHKRRKMQVDSLLHRRRCCGALLCGRLIPHVLKAIIGCKAAVRQATERACAESTA